MSDIGFDLDRATQGLNNDDNSNDKNHNDKESTTLIGAASEIQQYSVFEKEQKKHINSNFFTLGKVLEFFKIGFVNGFIEGIILINMIIFLQVIYPTFKEYFLDQGLTANEKFIWFMISYFPMIVLTIWLSTLARFYHGSITKKATLSLLTGRTLAFLAKALIVFFLFSAIYEVSMNSQEATYHFLSFFTVTVEFFLPDNYILTNDDLWNYYINYIIPSLKETTINTFIGLVIFAVIPYIIVITTGIVRVVKQVKGGKTYDEY
ncbi:MAG: hypothetical protein CL624_09355 [Arcobacter sp.]|nr:hypothetical protein [Arcobacter sp.]|tara:strand:- start:9309 stop:10097 length:789 start_codon:yes stop_codon:yes gene_type:complete